MKKLICLLLGILLIFGNTACGNAEAEPTALPATAPAANAATEIPVTVETEPPATTVPTEPPLVLHSGLREDGSFDEGTWFIGDSMTCILVTDYLQPNARIGDANYTGKYGTQITAFYDTEMSYTSYGRCIFNPEYEGMTYAEVGDQLGEQVTAIYLMWGTNFTWNAYADMYIDLVDHLLETCPNATVHMQLIPWGYPELVHYETVNEWIQEAYNHYQQAGEPRVMLIDTFTAIGRNHDEGGIHLNYDGNECWYNAIVAHAKEHNLEQ